KISVEAMQAAAGVVVLENVSVFLLALGHSDGTDLTHPDAVSESGAAEHERLAVIGRAERAHGEEGALEAAEHASDREVAAYHRDAAIAAHAKPAHASGHAALERLEVAHASDVRQRGGDELVELRGGNGDGPAVAPGGVAAAAAVGAVVVGGEEALELGGADAVVPARGGA